MKEVNAGDDDDKDGVVEEGVEPGVPWGKEDYEFFEIGDRFEGAKAILWSKDTVEGANVDEICDKKGLRVRVVDAVIVGCGWDEGDFDGEDIKLYDREAGDDIVSCDSKDSTVVGEEADLVPLTFL